MIRRFAAVIVAFAVFCSVPAARSLGLTLRRAPSLDLKEAFPQAETPFRTGYVPALQSSEGGTPSTSRAVLYSLLLPGLGQYALGEKGAAVAFFAAEGAIWTSFVVFEVQSRLRREQYKEYALVFADISTTDHSDDFYREIGDFDSSEEYELYIKKDGRAYTYPNSEYETLENYFVQNRISDFEPWAWRSTDDREQYYSLRWGSRLASRRALYSLAAALGNRVFSAVLALRSSRGASESAAEGSRRFHLGLASYPDREGGVRMNLSLARNFFVLLSSRPAPPLESCRT